MAKPKKRVNTTLNREAQLILKMAGILAAPLSPNSVGSKPENAVKKAKELLKEIGSEVLAEAAVGEVAALFFAARSPGSSDSIDVKNAASWAAGLLIYAVSEAAIERP